jgi:hypothetical protein
VFLVGGFAGLGAASLETQSKDYWAGTAPYSIKTFKASGTTLDLEVTNNDIEQLTLTDVNIDGTSVWTSNGTVFDSGETQTISATLPATCGAVGDPFQYPNVRLTYNKGGVTGLTQVGAKPLVGKCS